MDREDTWSPESLPPSISEKRRTSFLTKVELVIYFLVTWFFLGLFLVVGVILLHDGMRRALGVRSLVGAAFLFLFVIFFKAIK